MRDVFRRCRLDALVTPTLPITALPVFELKRTDNVSRLNPYTAPFNLTGNLQLRCPAVCITAVADRAANSWEAFDESGIMRIAAAYEHVAPWSGQHPELATADCREHG